MSLERELREIGTALAWPEAPDVADAVLRQIQPSTRASRQPVLRRRSLAVVVVLVAAAVAAVMSVPEARTTVLRALGIGAVQIAEVDDLPAVTPQSDLSSLGPVLSRAEVDQLFPEPLLEFGGDLREPDELRALDRPSIASYVWHDDAGDIRLLVSQLTQGFPDARLVKVTGPGATVERLTIDGRDALWVAGGAHGFGLDDGTFEPIRLSRSALLVDEGQTTIRIEGDLSRGAAIELYRALR